MKYHLILKKGNIYTILGRTLSGKTTLLKTIAGLLTPDKGEMQFEDKDFLKVPVWERNIAMVYQQFINYPHLNGFENVAFPLKQRKIDNHEINDVVLKISQISWSRGLRKKKNSRIIRWSTAKSFSSEIFGKECKDFTTR